MAEDRCEHDWVWEGKYVLLTSSPSDRGICRKCGKRTSRPAKGGLLRRSDFDKEIDKWSDLERDTE